MKLNFHEIAGLMDFSVLRTENTESDIRNLVTAALEHQSHSVFVLPSNVKLARQLLGDNSTIAIGSVIGFPTGGVTTATKAAEALELKELSCDEPDMVINVGQLLSGNFQAVFDDIKAVVDASAGLGVKVILECHYLNDEQIAKGCELSIDAGAAYVKTGTGWAPTGATAANIALIKSVVGDRVGIKAAGGIRSLDTLIQLYQLGARRFGVGLQAGLDIIEQCKAAPGGVVEV